MSEEIRRRTARSGLVDFSDAVVIHETSKLRIELIPFYVGRSLHVKIERHDKVAGGSPTSVSLDDAAVDRLREALNHRSVVAKGGTGSFHVIKADGALAQMTDAEIDATAQAINRLLSTEGAARGLSLLDLNVDLVRALRTEVRLRELRDAVQILADHLDDEVAEEQAYQKWCEEHSWAFGNAYVVNDRLRSISATDQVDLLLPSVLGGFRDLIELKRPDMTVLGWDRSRRSHYWSSDCSKALGQCHRYLDVLHSEVADGRLRDSPEVVAYHPRATVVIGRSQEWTNDQHRALHGLNRRLSDITVITYDHLLAQAKRTLELLESPEVESATPLPSDSNEHWSLDEAPF